MSLTTPTTTALKDEITAQLSASLEQSVPILPKAFLRVIAAVLAGAIVIVYRYAGAMHLNMFIRTASSKPTTVNGQTFTPLVEHGRENGTGDPKPAVRAELVVTVTVTSQTGSLAAGAQLLHSDTGLIFVTKSARALDAATVDVTVRAASVQGEGDGSGTVGNLDVGTELDFANPLPNVQRTATVASIAVYGADAEDMDTTYRARVLERSQAAPQGGAYADYRIWAQTANGVRTAYPYTGAPGEVDVYVEATTTVDPDGIPDGTTLTAAATAITYDGDGFANRRSANSKVNVLPIARTGFAVDVTALNADDPVTVKAAIQAGVDEWLRSREPFILGLSVLPRLDRITQGEVAGVVTTIASSYGATVSSVAVRIGAAPVIARTLGFGEKAKLDGNITWL